MNEYSSNTPPGQMPPPPPPNWAPTGGSGGPGAVSENRQVFLVLSYLGPLALLPFLMEKNDREVQWHAKHGLVLTAVSIVLSVVLFVVAFVASFVPLLGCVIWLGYPVFGLAMFALFILCIVKALNGERFLIPGISQFADKF